MNANLVSTSKFLSLVLRHQPEKIGLSLDPQGWADVEELLRRSAAAGRPLTRGLLEEVVATNDKQRFVLNEDGSRIRANQGHSVAVDLGLTPTVPPPRPLPRHGHALSGVHPEPGTAPGQAPARPPVRRRRHSHQGRPAARHPGGAPG